MAGNVSERFERTFTLNNQGSPIVITPVVEEEVPTTGGGDDNGAPAGSNNTSNNAPVSPFVAALNNAVQPAALATTFIAAVNNASDTNAQTPSEIIGEVLGTTTTEADEAGEVAGASDKAGWSLADMAWYWWVVAVLGAMGVWLMIAAASRRLRGVES